MDRAVAAYLRTPRGKRHVQVALCLMIGILLATAVASVVAAGLIVYYRGLPVWQPHHGCWAIDCKVDA